MELVKEDLSSSVTVQKEGDRTQGAADHFQLPSRTMSGVFAAVCAALCRSCSSHGPDRTRGLVAFQSGCGEVLTLSPAFYIVAVKESKILFELSVSFLMFSPLKIRLSCLLSLVSFSELSKL